MAVEIVGDEIWKSVPGYEGRYEVSNTGLVRSLLKSQKHPDPPTVIRLSVGTGGYLRCNLFSGFSTTPCNVQVHRLVALAFLGTPKSPRIIAAHNNGDCLDNRIENIRWATYKENSLDTIIHSKLRGKKRPTTKLTEQQVVEIKNLLSTNQKLSGIAAQYCVSYNTIWCIKTGRIWKHLQ